MVASKELGWFLSLLQLRTRCQHAPAKRLGTCSRQQAGVTASTLVVLFCSFSLPQLLTKSRLHPSWRTVAHTTWSMRPWADGAAHLLWKLMDVVVQHRSDDGLLQLADPIRGHLTSFPTTSLCQASRGMSGALSAWSSSTSTNACPRYNNLVIICSAASQLLHWLLEVQWLHVLERLLWVGQAAGNVSRHSRARCQARSHQSAALRSDMTSPRPVQQVQIHDLC